MDDETRTTMESQIGADFSSVRVHTGAAAQRSADAVAARAYTVGEDVVFSDGVYNPSSDSGRRTLAHELTHVVQQRQGPVDGVQTSGGISVSDPSDRFERAAEATADAVMAGRGPAVQAERGDQPAPAPIQREVPGQDEEPLEEGLQAQRQAEGEEELTEEEA